MSPFLLEAILSYVTIPLYVIGLLTLISIIAHAQLGFSFSGEAKELMQAKSAPKRPTVPVSSYLVVFVLFALFTVLTITSQRRKEQ